MKQCLDRFCENYAPLRNLINVYIDPVVILAVRLYLTNLFFISGWSKLEYVLRGQTDMLYALFADNTFAFMTSPFAAWLWMSGELAFSALLTVGFLTRFAALGLILMSLIIFAADQATAAHYWLLLSAVIFARGAGLVSVDAWLWRKCVVAHDPPAHPETFG